MADFCQQCSIDTFDEDNRDLANLSLDSETGACLALCEGCGMVTVDKRMENALTTGARSTPNNLRTVK